MDKIVAGCLNITKGDDKSKNIGKHYSMIICIYIYDVFRGRDLRWFGVQIGENFRSSGVLWHVDTGYT